MAYKYDQYTEDYQRAVHARSDSVETLRDRNAGHTDCKQSYVTHYVSETAYSVKEVRKCICKACFQTLSEGLVRRHSSEQQHQDERNADQSEYRYKVDVLVDYQVKSQQVHRNYGDSPAQAGDP